YFDSERGGHIINVGSTSAYRVRLGSGFYAATKFAVRAMTEGLRMELAQANSRTKVTLISPGRVATSFFQSGPEDDKQPLDIPLKPNDVATVVLTTLQSPDDALISEIVLRHKNQIP